ncbi:MAG: hypothetical protein DRG59_03140 [Deltaproteobacteria bacterium]|nr:MAG: hypothetical protein DRG59_03140 [Deltaproteobacteria bacterium]
MLNKIFSMNISEDETVSLVFFGWIEHDLVDLQPVRVVLTNILPFKWQRFCFPAGFYKNLPERLESLAVNRITLGCL